jgi:hypothetical protein
MEDWNKFILGLSINDELELYRSGAMPGLVAMAAGAGIQAEATIAFVGAGRGCRAGGGGVGGYGVADRAKPGTAGGSGCCVIEI